MTAGVRVLTRRWLAQYAILAVLAVFLLYPIGYVVPNALTETDEPFAVHLTSAGSKPQDVANALVAHVGMKPQAARDAVDQLPQVVVRGQSLADALAVARELRTVGGTSRLEGSLRPTLFYIRQVFVSPFLWQCLASSLFVAFCATLITTIVTLPLAIWLTRFQFVGRGLVSVLLLVPLILPPFVGAIGFQQIFSRFGTLNLWLQRLGLIDGPIDWLGRSGLLGLIALEVLHLYPIMYLNVAAALANVDPSLEEAARNLGSSEWLLFRRVTFPLVLPGYFAGAAIVFVWAFTDLGTPIVLGYQRVISYQVFDKLSEAETNPSGYALVLVTLLLTAALYSLARWVTGRSQYVVVTKGSVASAARPAGRVRTTVILSYAGLLTSVAVLPHVAVVLTSVAARWSFTPLPTEFTTDYFVLAMTHKLAGTSIRNSLEYSLASTLVDIVLGVSIAYLVARRPSWLSRTLDGVAMLPLALPGLVLAFGYLTCYHRPAEWFAAAAEIPGIGYVAGWLAANLDPQKSPLLLLVVAYAMRRLPYMSRAALAGFQQTAPVYEEAAENLGATRWRIMRQITLPLIAANIVAGSILTFSFAVLEVSDSIMLAQRENYFPITKAIYVLLGRPDDGPYIASAMGVLGMLLLAAALAAATAVLGRRLGELFRG